MTFERVGVQRYNRSLSVFVAAAPREGGRPGCARRVPATDTWAVPPPPRTVRKEAIMGSVIKKRRKRMSKKKHRKLLRKTRHQRRNKK